MKYTPSVQMFGAFKPPLFPSIVWPFLLGPHLVTQTGPAGNPLSQRSGFDGGAESAVRPGSDSGRQCAEARRSALHLALGQRKLLGYLSFYLYLYLSIDLSIFLSFFDHKYIINDFKIL